MIELGKDSFLKKWLKMAAILGKLRRMSWTIALEEQVGSWAENTQEKP